MSEFQKFHIVAGRLNYPGVKATLGLDPPLKKKKKKLESHHEGIIWINK